MAQEPDETTTPDTNPNPNPDSDPNPSPNDGPTNEKIKSRRHPRWSRQETIILIGAKKMIENGGSAVCRFSQAEPKWESVATFCQKHGVNRGPVQCRKRWSNLLSDFKKIKKWETSIKNESESFWRMRNDERRDKKLPGFFDGEVYNVLNGGTCTASAFPLTLVKVGSNGEDDDDDGDGDDDEGIFDGEKMGWSSEEGDGVFELVKCGKKVNDSLNGLGVGETMLMGNSDKTVHKEPKQSLVRKSEANFTGSGKRIIESMSPEGRKRRKVSPENHDDDAAACMNPLMKVLRRNGNLLKAHLSDQNRSYQLARDQQKEQTSSIVAALGKLTDALIKIADKL